MPKKDELAVLESLGLELHKLYNWFEQEGAIELGWDAADARSHNFALRMMKADITGHRHDIDPSQFIMNKPANIQATEDFFQMAEFLVALRSGHATYGNEVYKESYLESGRLTLENAYNRILFQLDEKPHPEISDGIEVLKKNIEAAMKIAHSDTAITVEQAGGDLQHYVHQGADMSHQDNKGKPSAPRDDTAKDLSIKLLVKWPELPEHLANHVYEKMAAAHEALIAHQADMQKHMRWLHRRSDRQTTESIEHYITETLVDGGKGLSPDNAGEIAKQHIKAVQDAVVKERDLLKKHASAEAHENWTDIAYRESWHR